MVGMVVKANISQLEEEVRVDNTRRMRMELNGVVKAIFGEEEVLGEVPLWVRKESVLESTHSRDTT